MTIVQSDITNKPVETPFHLTLFSLENKSDKIRWSLDLRFQTPDKSPGFYGMKGTVLFRTAKDPNHEIPWEDFNGVDRHIAAHDKTSLDTESKSNTAWRSNDKEVDFVPLFLDLEF